MHQGHGQAPLLPDGAAQAGDHARLRQGSGRLQRPPSAAVRARAGHDGYEGGGASARGLCAEAADAGGDRDVTISSLGGE